LAEMRTGTPDNDLNCCYDERIIESCHCPFFFSATSELKSKRPPLTEIIKTGSIHDEMALHSTWPLTCIYYLFKQPSMALSHWHHLTPRPASFLNLKGNRRVMQKECTDEQLISSTRARRLRSASTRGHLFFLLQWGLEALSLNDRICSRRSRRTLSSESSSRAAMAAQFTGFSTPNHYFTLRLEGSSG
jgi:hypothetical protein